MWSASLSYAAIASGCADVDRTLPAFTTRLAHTGRTLTR